MGIETYYTVLGVAETASQAEIKAAYRDLVQQVHPDSLPNASPYWKHAAEEKTKEINEEVLRKDCRLKQHARVLSTFKDQQRTTNA